MDRLNLDKVKIMAAAATLAMFAGTACAHVELYAEVNKVYEQVWTEEMDTGIFGDNNYSPSKVGVMSSAHLNKCVTFGGVAELEFLPNNTRLASELVTEDLLNHIVYARKLEAWASAGMWGKLSLGLGEAASWNITNISYAGTNQTSLGSSVANNAGGMIFIIKNANNAASTSPNVNIVFNALNGVGDIDSFNGVLSTKDRVRYDTADWMGFKASVSYGNVTKNFASLTLEDEITASLLAAQTRRTFFDVALRYSGCWDDFMFGAGVAGAWYNRDGSTREPFSTFAGTGYRDRRAWSGSLAVEHKPTGFNAAVAGGQRRKIVKGLDEYGFWYVQLGKKFCFTNYGKTNVAVDWFQSRNSIQNSDRGNSWSVGVTQDLCKIHSAVYASVRNYKYADTRPSYEDIFVMTLGVQFKFGAML
ncbi:MAG TPA: hypothetical protein VLG38_07665 [Gammaproteobacteria bacterium]|nr:hypothetical protein [Gammaproteobacteria bacterium]